MNTTLKNRMKDRISTQPLENKRSVAINGYSTHLLVCIADRDVRDIRDELLQEEC